MLRGALGEGVKCNPLAGIYGEGAKSCSMDFGCIMGQKKALNNVLQKIVILQSF